MIRGEVSGVERKMGFFIWQGRDIGHEAMNIET